MIEKVNMTVEHYMCIWSLLFCKYETYYFVQLIYAKDKKSE
jgi:hypothetical protein